MEIENVIPILEDRKTASLLLDGQRRVGIVVDDRRGRFRGRRRGFSTLLEYQRAVGDFISRFPEERTHRARSVGVHLWIRIPDFRKAVRVKFSKSEIEAGATLNAISLHSIGRDSVTGASFLNRPSQVGPLGFNFFCCLGQRPKSRSLSSLSSSVVLQRSVPMSEEGELPPSPTGSDSVSYGNGHIDRDAGDDDVFVGGNEDSRNGASSNALFEYNTDGTNSDIFNDDVQLNVTGGTNSDEVNIRKSFSTPSLLTFEKQATPQATSIRRNKPVCFNCEGDHVLANCHEPRDNEKIRLAANKFKRESTGGTPRNSRETGSAGGSYGNTKFRPGRISNKLRAALGLRSDDIPSWIYRMRRLGFIDGYPPSYLKQAIVFEDDPASLLSFNFIDDKLNQKEDQADQSKSFALPTIRKEKIIWYGGYNKYFSNLYDREGNAFRIPPFESFVAQLEKDVQSRAKGDWEHQKRSRAQKRKMFSNEEASSSLLLPPPPLPTKRARMEKGEVSSTNDMSMDSTKDESLLNINEASICSSVGDESPTGLSPEFDAGIDAPDIIARPFNKTADDLGRFSQGIQPFQETIEQAQGDGKFLKSLMVLMKARRTK